MHIYPTQGHTHRRPTLGRFTPMHARAITDNINTSSLLINLCPSGKATTRPRDPVTLTNDEVDAITDQIGLLRAKPDLVPHDIPNRDRLMRILLTPYKSVPIAVDSEC